MKKVFFLAFLMLLVFPSTSLAHSGRTASDGCHYCRTNCASYGYVTGTRHCHNGVSSVPAVKYEAPKTSVVETKEPEKQVENEIEEKEPVVSNNEEVSAPVVKYEAPKIPVVETKEPEKQIESKVEEEKGSVLNSEEKKEVNETPKEVTKEKEVEEKIEDKPKITPSVQKTKEIPQNNSGTDWFWPLVIGGGAGYFIKSKIDKKK